MGLRFNVPGVGFRFEVSGFRDSGLVFTVYNLMSRFLDLGSRVQNKGFRASGLRCRV